MTQTLARDAVTYLTTEDVAARYRTTAPTVRYWRHTGYGPRGVKIGRRVLYSLAEIERWDREISSAADTPRRGGAA